MKTTEENKGAKNTPCHARLDPVSSKKNTFATLLAAAKNAQEIEELFSALLTPAEKKTLQERVEIVEGLLAEKTQRKISEETGASLATISRGSREIKFGSGILQKLFSRVFKNS